MKRSESTSGLHAACTRARTDGWLWLRNNGLNLSKLGCLTGSTVIKSVEGRPYWEPTHCLCCNVEVTMMCLTNVQAKLREQNGWPTIKALALITAASPKVACEEGKCEFCPPPSFGGVELTWILTLFGETFLGLIIWPALISQTLVLKSYNIRGLPLKTVPCVVVFCPYIIPLSFLTK
ncbi:unnamed protein product, partial [Sphenostylis stenocarpa]